MAEFDYSQYVTKSDIYDDFEEGAALGEGAYGRVWVGTRKSDGQNFAVKTIDGGEETALGREALLKPPRLVSLNNPAIFFFRI